MADETDDIQTPSLQYPVESPTRRDERVAAAGFNPYDTAADSLRHFGRQVLENLPVVGHGVQAYEAAQRGEPARATLHSLGAAADIALPLAGKWLAGKVPDYYPDDPTPMASRLVQGAVSIPSALSGLRLRYMPQGPRNGPTEGVSLSRNLAGKEYPNDFEYEIFKGPQRWGDVSGELANNGRSAFVNWMGSGANRGRTSAQYVGMHELGIPGLRTLGREMRSDFPGRPIENVMGWRASGARAKLDENGVTGEMTARRPTRFNVAQQPDGTYAIVDPKTGNVLSTTHSLGAAQSTANRLQSIPLPRSMGGRIEAAAAQTERNPTDAQKKSGNYTKGKVRLHGLEIAIENPKGGERSGTDKGGKAWSVKMPAHYGYVKGTEGKDGDHVDVYIGPQPDSSKVFVVDQVDASSGKFDEHKCMLGYGSKADALADYKKAFSDGKGADRVGNVTELSIDTFKSWLRSGKTKQPMAHGAYAAGGSIMPSKTPKQARFMAAIAHDPAFAEKVGVPQRVGKDFNSADAGTGILRRAAGGDVSQRALQVARRYAGGRTGYADGATVEDPDIPEARLPSTASYLPHQGEPRLDVYRPGGAGRLKDMAVEGTKALAENLPGALWDAVRPPDLPFAPFGSGPDFKNLPTREERLQEIGPVKGWRDFATEMGPTALAYMFPTSGPEAKALAKFATRTAVPAAVVTAGGADKASPAELDHAAPFEMAEAAPNEFQVAEATQKKAQPSKGSGRIDMGGWTRENAEGPYPGPDRAHDDVLTIQEEMRKRGFFAGKSDGMDGGGTRNAEWRMIQADRKAAASKEKKETALGKLKTAEEDPKNQPGMTENESYGYGLAGGTAAGLVNSIIANLANRWHVRGVNKILEPALLPRKAPKGSKGVETATRSEAAGAVNDFARKGEADAVPFAAAPKSEAGWKYDPKSTPVGDWFPPKTETWRNPSLETAIKYGLMGSSGVESGMSHIMKRNAEEKQAAAWTDMMDPAKNPEGPNSADISRYIEAKKNVDFWNELELMGRTGAAGVWLGSKIGKVVPKGGRYNTAEAEGAIGNLNQEINTTNKTGKRYNQKTKAKDALEQAEAEAEMKRRQALADAKLARKTAQPAASKTKKKKTPDEGDSGQGKLLGLAGAGTLLPSPVGEGEEPTLPVSPEITQAFPLSDEQDLRNSGGKVEKHYSNYQPRREGKFAGGPVYPQRKHGGRTSQPQGDDGYSKAVNGALSIARKIGGAVRAGLDVSSKALAGGGNVKVLPTPKVPKAQAVVSGYEMWVPPTPVPAEMVPGFLGSKNANDKASGGQVWPTGGNGNVKALPTPNVPKAQSVVPDFLGRKNSVRRATGGPAERKGYQDGGGEFDTRDWNAVIPLNASVRTRGPHASDPMPRTFDTFSYSPDNMTKRLKLNEVYQDVLRSGAENDAPIYDLPYDGGAYPGFSTGGTPDANNKGRISTGLVHGPTGGREDARPVSVRSGAFVIPADIVAALGTGNTMAGATVLDKTFKKRPMRYGGVNMATGGDVPIKISDGEYLIDPEQVAEVGSGDMNRGHAILDKFVLEIRRKHINDLSRLPPPAKS